MSLLAESVHWHGRLMVLAWAVLFPAGVLTARFLKITPRQRWPDKTDNKLWWYAHLVMQYSGVALVSVALLMIGSSMQGVAMDNSMHGLLGWLLVVLMCVQVLSGWLRGSKGGPTECGTEGSVRGDHFDMSRRRRMFEQVHKPLGHAAILIAIIAILSGLRAASAPFWMYVVLSLWWLLLLMIIFWGEKKGLKIDTYRAIWGHDVSPNVSKIAPMPAHPWKKES